MGEDRLSNQLGATLAHYREMAGLSIPQLAGAVAVDRAYLHALEVQPADWVNHALGGVPPRQPSRDLLIRIALVLHLSLDQCDDLLMSGGYAPLVVASRAQGISRATATVGADPR